MRTAELITLTHSILKPVLRYGAVLLITFVLLEIALTFLDPFLFKGLFQYDEELGFRVRPHVSGSNEFGFNDIDRPHVKPDNTYRIVVLGDSFNWAGGISCNYISLLADKLATSTIGGKRIEVINAGYPATAPHEGYLVLKRYAMQYDPDMVILGFFVGNDFEDPNKKMIVINANLYRIDRRHELTLFGTPVIGKSRLAEIVAQHVKIKQSVKSRETRARDTKPDVECAEVTAPPEFTEVAFLKLTALKLRFYDRKYKTFFEPHIEFVRKTVAEMDDYLADQQVAFRVALLPDEAQVDPQLLEAAIAHDKMARSDLDMERPQRLMATILSARGVEFFDLLPAFREAFAREPALPLYLPLNTHWNYRGNSLAADAIHTWLSADLVDATEPGPRPVQLKPEKDPGSG